MKIVVVGGGWAGASAAYFAKKAGAEVIIIEKTDMLLGTGLVGGIFRNNGRFTAAEEISALGGEDFINILDQSVRHYNVDFPGHKHASIYDVTKIESALRKFLLYQGIELKLRTRIVDVIKEKDQLIGVIDTNKNSYYGDAFIDTTGSAGPVKNCTKYGSGCVMCILRCPSFGPRISIVEKLGIKEFKAAVGVSDMESMSGSCKLEKSSLSTELVEELNEKGVVIIPLSKEFHHPENLERKACQQYARKEFAENLILLDTGHAKLMTTHFPVDILRTIEGFKNARFADPYSGGQGNSIRFMAIAPVELTMRVKGQKNLFAAGEKAGLFVGHTEAILTGMLAGHNSIRAVLGKPLLILPQALAVGDFIAYSLEQMQTPHGREQKYTFSGSVYFQRMLNLGLYLTNKEIIRKKVKSLSLLNRFNKSII